MARRKQPQLDYSVRYGSNYAGESAIAWKKHQKLNNLCVCCLKKKAKELHHTSYGGKPLSRLYDNWFPVCLRCHQVAHKKVNWKQCRKDPVWNNRSTVEFKRRLVLGVSLLKRDDN
jgi:hypothetical protein